MSDEALGLWGIPSFYPTPLSITDRLIDLACIQPKEVILEPSAGKGDIAQRIRQRYPNNPLYVGEKNLDLRRILVCQGFHLVTDDFLRWELPVDVIIQNPPFSNNYQDIDHFCQAWRTSRRCVVSLLHEYSGFTKIGSPRYKPRVFQDWMTRKGIRREMSPEGSFLNSEFPTNVRTCIVWGEKWNPDSTSSIN